MTAITALQENFTTAAVGQTITDTNTIFDTVAGTGTSTFITDPFDSSLRMMEVSTAANTKFHEMDFTATALLWFRFDLDIETTLGTNTSLLNGYLNNAGLAADKVFDLQVIGGTRTLRLRDVSSTVWTSTALADNVKHRIYLYVKLSAPKQIRVMIYSGGDNTTLSQDSGVITSTAAPVTISHLRMGIISTDTGVLRFGALRGDDATQPFPAGAASVSLGPDQSVAVGATVTFPVTTSGTATLSLTQTSGPTVTLSGTGATRSFTMPGSASPTTITFLATYGTASDTLTIDAPAVSASTTINALVEDFAGGALAAAITTGNTIFDNVSGTGTGVFITDPFNAGLRMAEVQTAADTKTFEMDFTAVPLLWFSMDIDIETTLAANTAILNGYLNNAGLAGDKIFDIQVIGGTRTIRLRNVSTTEWTSTALADNVKHRIYIMVKMSAPKQLRVMIYSGGTNVALSQDSGIITSTATPTTIGHLRAGVLGNDTGIVRFGRFRADSATQPIPAGSSSISLGDNQTVETGDTVTFPVTTTGTGTVSITQTAGPAVTLSGSGATRSFVMPGIITAGVPQATSLTFEATFGGATDSLIVAAPIWPDWYMLADGSRKPEIESRYAT